MVLRASFFGHNIKLSITPNRKLLTRISSSKNFSFTNIQSIYFRWKIWNWRILSIGRFFIPHAFSFNLSLCQCLTHLPREELSRCSFLITSNLQRRHIRSCGKGNSWQLSRNSHIFQRSIWAHSGVFHWNLVLGKTRTHKIILIGSWIGNLLIPHRRLEY